MVTRTNKKISVICEHAPKISPLMPPICFSANQLMKIGIIKTVQRPIITKIGPKIRKKVEQIERLNNVSLTFTGSKELAELFIEIGELNLRSITIDVLPPQAVMIHAKIIVAYELREAKRVIRRK